MLDLCTVYAKLNSFTYNQISFYSLRYFAKLTFSEVTSMPLKSPHSAVFLCTLHALPQYPCRQNSKKSGIQPFPIPKSQLTLQHFSPHFLFLLCKKAAHPAQTSHAAFSLYHSLFQKQAVSYFNFKYLRTGSETAPAATQHTHHSTTACTPTSSTMNIKAFCAPRPCASPCTYSQ